MNVAMILSGGSGKRFGQEVPKQYQLVLGKPVVQYVVEAVKKVPKIDKVFL